MQSQPGIPEVVWALHEQMEWMVGIAGAHREDSEGRERFILQAGLLKAIFEIADKSGIDLKPPHVPFVYNTATPDLSAPLAGYLDGERPQLAQAFSGRIGTWTLLGEAGHSFPRVMKSALWLALHDDPYEAVDFSLRLGAHGLANGRTLLAVLMHLDRFLDETPSGELRVKSEAFEGDSVPQTTAQWIECIPSYPDETQTDSYRPSAWMNSAVVASAGRIMDWIRSASGLDQYAARHCMSLDTIRVALAMLRDNPEPRPVAVNGAIDVLEEVKADCGALLRMLCSKLVTPDLANTLSLTSGVIIAWKSLFEDDPTVDRFRDRTVVPHALEKHFLAKLTGNSMPTLPDAWSRGGAWFGPVFEGRVFDAPDALVRARKHQEGGWQLASGEDIERESSELLRTVQAFGDQRNMGQRVMATASFLEEYPLSWLALQEHAISLDLSGDPGGACRLITDALLLAPWHPHIWQSFAVVLGRLDQQRDAAVAAAIAHMMQQRITQA